LNTFLLSSYYNEKPKKIPGAEVRELPDGSSGLMSVKTKSSKENEGSDSSQ